MNSFTHYAQWRSWAISLGAQLESGGDGKLYAHIDGVEWGVWDGLYGGAGFGWFYSRRDG